MSNDDVEIDVSVCARTPNAIQVYDGNKKTWIPRSQISDYTGDSMDNAESIFIPEWMAIEKGLI